ncbi:MAG TPA: uracil-DNA glycosylase, partial [Kofleriaceae bacterium]
MEPGPADDDGSTDLGDVDDVGELRELARQLRGQLLRHAALGAWAAPGGVTARHELPVIEAPPVAEPAVIEAAPVVDHDYHPKIFEHGVPDEVVADAAFPIVPPRRTLQQIRDELGDCTRCKLSATRRTIVYGVGAADTPLMFVGEAPGEQEDRRGEPFVGPAGQLLDKMIEAMGWTRASVYIANTTK